MFETRDRNQAQQDELWVVRDKLPTPVVSAFFRKLDRTLNDIEPPLSPAFRWGGCGRDEKGNPYQFPNENFWRCNIIIR